MTRPKTLVREVPQLAQFFNNHPMGKYVGGYNLVVKKFGVEVLDIALNLNRYPDGTYDRETAGWVVKHDGSFNALPMGERVLDSTAMRHHEVRRAAVTVCEGLFEYHKEQIFCVVVHRFVRSHGHEMTVYVRPSDEIFDRI